MNENTLSRDDY